MAVKPVPDEYPQVVAWALAAGARELRPLGNQFYGDGSGQFEDPWGTAGALLPRSRTCPKTR